MPYSEKVLTGPLEPLHRLAAGPAGCFGTKSKAIFSLTKTSPASSAQAYSYFIHMILEWDEICYANEPLAH
jgi:hypothetical protein